MMAVPPAFSTLAATASESVATTTSPMAAARARRMTCTIIGSPAMSASGLPGSREAAIRAGMMIKMSLPAIGLREVSGKPRCRAKTRAKVSGACPLYGLPGVTQTGYLCGRYRPFPRAGDRTVLDSFEMNKVLGAVLGTCLGVVALNIAAGAVFTPGKLDKPGFDIDVPKSTPGNGTKETPAPPE